MAGRSVTAATNPTPIPSANAGPIVENTSNWVNIIPTKVTATVAADAAITLPMDAQSALYRFIRIHPLPYVVVVAADQKDGVIHSCAGDHSAQEDQSLGRNRADPNWATPARTPCAVASEMPIVINGSNMVIRFR